MRQAGDDSSLSFTFLDFRAMDLATVLRMRWLAHHSRELEPESVYLATGSWHPSVLDRFHVHCKPNSDS